MPITMAALKFRGWRLSHKPRIKLAVIAEACGVSIATVSRWESGDGVPRPEKRGALAEVLGRTKEEIDELFDGADGAELVAQ